jgi:hypothetical protein
MNQHQKHLDQDEFVLAYYDEPGIAAQREHLAACGECRAELGRLASVLDKVMPGAVPEPAADYEARVWDRMAWRLRGERKAAARGSVTKWLAAAAVLALAFIGGLFWNRSNSGPVQIANQPSPTALAQPTASSTQQQRDRILLVVVGDHFDDSERMLVELTNLTPTDGIDVSAEQQRAEELLASNRLYRRTALDRGEDRVATLLDELEPVLMQIAHGPSQMTPDELRKVQKRVETKGLVFKLRVLRADVRATSVPHLQQPNI